MKNPKETIQNVIFAMRAYTIVIPIIHVYKFRFKTATRKC